eukprot:977146-Pelagomonas_calceolata.AAC.1
MLLLHCYSKLYCSHPVSSEWHASTSDRSARDPGYRLSSVTLMQSQRKSNVACLILSSAVCGFYVACLHQRPNNQ